MIKSIDFDNIFTLLGMVEYKKSSENIKLAKGKYFLPTSWNELWRKTKLMIAR